jgi:hypothetical protein
MRFGMRLNIINGKWSVEDGGDAVWGNTCVGRRRVLSSRPTTKERCD